MKISVTINNPIIKLYELNVLGGTIYKIIIYFSVPVKNHFL